MIQNAVSSVHFFDNTNSGIIYADHLNLNCFASSSSSFHKLLKEEKKRKNCTLL